MHSLLHSAVLAALLGLPLESHSQSFVLSTEEAGLAAASNSNGVAVADYDLDGDLDVYFVNARLHDESDPNTWSRLYSNNGDGIFKRRGGIGGGGYFVEVPGGSAYPVVRAR